jgi:hypothetical protein
MNSSFLRPSSATRHRRTRESDLRSQGVRHQTNAFDGKSVILEAPAELEELRPRDAALVSHGLRRLFTDFPTSFHTLAKETTFAPLARWLRRMGNAGACELAIERPGIRAARAGVKPSIVLRVGPSDARLQITGPLSRVPKRCPPVLAEVLRRIGVVSLEYGSAGGLLAPAEQRSLPDLYAEIAENWRPPRGGVNARAIYDQYVALGIIDSSSDFEAFAADLRRSSEASAREAENLPRPAASPTYFAFFQNACGGYLTVNRSGKTWYVPMGGGDYAPGPPLERWLARFFRPDFAWT